MRTARKNHKGDIIEWIGTATNITEAKKADRALRQSEESLRQSQDRLRDFNAELEQQVAERTTELKKTSDKIKEDAHFITQILDTTPDIAYIMDLNTYQLIYANRQVSAELGYDKEQIRQMNNPLLDIMHPDDINRFKDHLKEIKTMASDDKVVEIQYRLKNLVFHKTLPNANNRKNNC